MQKDLSMLGRMAVLQREGNLTTRFFNKWRNAARDTQVMAHKWVCIEHIDFHTTASLLVVIADG